MPLPVNPDHNQGRAYSWPELTLPLDQSLTIAREKIERAREDVAEATQALNHAKEGARIIGIQPLMVEIGALLVKAKVLRDTINGMAVRIGDADEMIDYRFRGMMMGLPKERTAAPAAPVLCFFCDHPCDMTPVTGDSTTYKGQPAHMGCCAHNGGLRDE